MPLFGKSGGGGVTDKDKWTKILSFLSISLMVFSGYLQFVQFFVVFTEELKYYFGFVGLFGQAILFICAMVIFLYLRAAKDGDETGLKGMLLFMFFFLFVPLVLIYVFFASITINAIIQLIMSSNRIGFKIGIVVLGILGMIIALFLLTPYMIMIKRFSDDTDKEPEPKFNKSDKKGKMWFFEYLGGWVYLLLVFYVGICQVFCSGVSWPTFILNLCFSLPANISGCLLVVVCWIVSSRILQGREDQTAKLITFLHVLQYVYLAFAICSLISMLIFGIIAASGSTNFIGDPTSPVIGLIMSAVGIGLVPLLMLPFIALFYLGNKA